MYCLVFPCAQAPKTNDRHIRIRIEPAAGGAQLFLSTAWVRNTTSEIAPSTSALGDIPDLSVCPLGADPATRQFNKSRIPIVVRLQVTYRRPLTKNLPPSHYCPGTNGR